MKKKYYIEPEDRVQMVNKTDNIYIVWLYSILYFMGLIGVYWVDSTITPIIDNSPFYISFPLWLVFILMLCVTYLLVRSIYRNFQGYWENKHPFREEEYDDYTNYRGY